MDRDTNALLATPTPGGHTPHLEQDGSISPEVSEEERVFALLFGQCDAKGVGLVDTKKLVSYIRNMQLQHRRPEGEELFESPDTSGGMEYDLEVLQSMLECNCDENNMVNEPTYSFIIRKWVNNVRDRTPASPPEPLLEVSQLTDSSLGPDDMDVSFGSYGLDDSHNSCSSRVSYSHQEWADIISKYQHEVKVLNERNKELVRQYDGSEESLKDHQSRNLVLQQKLVEAQASAVKLREMQGLNAEISKVVTETQKTNEELAWTKERLNRDLDRVKEELEEIRTNLSNTEDDRDAALKDLKTMQQHLIISKETEKETRTELESKLEESRSQLELKHSDLFEANSKLNSVISELEIQLLQAKSHEKLPGPFSSTPYRHTPSLHEEMHGQENLMNGSVPVSPLKYEEVDPQEQPPPPSRVEEISRSVHRETHITPAIDSFTKLMEETDTKINWKHSLILRDLSDLMPQQSPSTSHLYRGSRETISQEGNSLNQSSISQVELKLMCLMRKKNQFKNDNMNLMKENEDLKNRMQILEEILAQYQYQGNSGDIGSSPRSNNSYVGDSSRGSSGDSGNIPKLCDGNDGSGSPGVTGGGTYQQGYVDNLQQKNTNANDSSSDGRNNSLPLHVPSPPHDHGTSQTSSEDDERQTPKQEESSLVPRESRGNSLETEKHDSYLDTDYPNLVTNTEHHHSPRSNNSYVGDSSRGSGNIPKSSDGNDGSGSPGVTGGGGGGGTYGTSPSFIAVNIEISTATNQQGNADNLQQKNTNANDSNSDGRNNSLPLHSPSPSPHDHDTSQTSSEDDGRQTPKQEESSPVPRESRDKSLETEEHSVIDSYLDTDHPNLVMNTEHHDGGNGGRQDLGVFEVVERSPSPLDKSGVRHPTPRARLAGATRNNSDDNNGSGRPRQTPKQEESSLVQRESRDKSLETEEHSVIDSYLDTDHPNLVTNTEHHDGGNGGGQDLGVFEVVERSPSPSDKNGVRHPTPRARLAGAACNNSDGNDGSGRPRQTPKQEESSLVPRESRDKSLETEEHSVIDSYLDTDYPNLVTNTEHHHPSSPIRGGLFAEQKLDPKSGYGVRHRASQTDDELLNEVLEVLSNPPEAGPVQPRPLLLSQSETQISDFVPCNDDDGGSGGGQDLGVFEVVERSPSPSDKSGVRHPTPRARSAGASRNNSPESATPLPRVQVSFGDDGSDEPWLKKTQYSSEVASPPPPLPHETRRGEYGEREEASNFRQKVMHDGGNPLVSSSYIGSWFSKVYRVLKSVVLMLFFIVLLLALLVLIVLSRDAVENCGSHCPHSPVQLLYSTLDPYLHFTKVVTPF